MRRRLTETQTIDGVRIVKMVDRLGGNHLSPAMLDELSDQILGNGGACVLMGTSEVFSIGRLRVAGAVFDPVEAERFLRALRRRSPLCVMAVEGATIGWGLGLVLSGAPRLGLESTYFGVGVWDDVDADLASTILQPLRAMIGPQRTAFLAYTGRSVDAATALDWGMLNRVAEQSALQADAIACARMR